MNIQKFQNVSMGQHCIPRGRKQVLAHKNRVADAHRKRTKAQQTLKRHKTTQRTFLRIAKEYLGKRFSLGEW